VTSSALQADVTPVARWLQTLPSANRDNCAWGQCLAGAVAAESAVGLVASVIALEDIIEHPHSLPATAKPSIALRSSAAPLGGVRSFCHMLPPDSGDGSAAGAPSSMRDLPQPLEGFGKSPAAHPLVVVVDDAPAWSRGVSRPAVDSLDLENGPLMFWGGRNGGSPRTNDDESDIPNYQTAAALRMVEQGNVSDFRGPSRLPSSWHESQNVHTKMEHAGLLAGGVGGLSARLPVHDTLQGMQELRCGSTPLAPERAAISGASPQETSFELLAVSDSEDDSSAHVPPLLLDSDESSPASLTPPPSPTTRNVSTGVLEADPPTEQHATASLVAAAVSLLATPDCRSPQQIVPPVATYPSRAAPTMCDALLSSDHPPLGVLPEATASPVVVAGQTDALPGARLRKMVAALAGLSTAAVVPPGPQQDVREGVAVGTPSGCAAASGKPTCWGGLAAETLGNWCNSGAALAVTPSLESAESGAVLATGAGRPPEAARAATRARTGRASAATADGALPAYTAGLHSSAALPQTLARHVCHFLRLALQRLSRFVGGGGRGVVEPVAGAAALGAVDAQQVRPSTLCFAPHD
jgi:hypothetical protein